MNTIRYERKKFAPLSPYAARFGNFFFCFDTVCTFDFYGRNIQIRPIDDKKIEDCAFVLVLRAETGIWKIAFQKDDILLFNPALKISADNFAEIKDSYESLFPVEVKQALLEDTFAPFIGQCAQKLGMEIAVENIELPAQNESFSAYLAFAFEENCKQEETSEQRGNPYHNIFYVQIPEEAQSLQVLAKLEQILVPEKKENQAFSALSFPLAFCVGQTELTVQNLLSVTSGDYILLDEYYPKNRQIRLYPCFFGQSDVAAFPAHNYLLGTIKEKEVEVVEWIHGCQKQAEPIKNEADAGADSAEDKKMEDKENSAPETEKSSPVAAENISVNVQFSLAERMMSLQDLQNINAGYVFALENDFLAPVTLLVNGTSIGKGKIVDINGTVGVQVIEINK